MVLRSLFLLSLLLGIGTRCLADDFQYGQYDDALAWKQYAKDTTANAVVIKEFGLLSRYGFSINPIQFYYHVRIKIFKKDGFNKGDVVIPLRTIDNENFEKIRDIKGITYFRNPDGSIDTKELDPQQILTEHKSKSLDYVKFAMPAIKDGCVIEYSYYLETPYSYNLKSWHLQDEIPKVESELKTIIAENFSYNAVLTGPYQLTSSTTKHVDKTFVSNYIMKDIPAFPDVSYLMNEDDYKSSINFTLQEYYDFYGNKREVAKEWKNVDLQLKESEYFGKAIWQKNAFKNILPSLLAEKTTDIEKATAIYRYLKDSIKWNGYEDIATVGGAKLLKERTGSVGDINLSLVAALYNAGLNAEPVLLSTRDNGLVNTQFPSLIYFNYVVARLTIGKDTFLLDATDPLLAFGMLPSRCFNGQGRVIPYKGESYWTDIKPAHKKATLYSINLVLNDDGKMKGTVECSYTGYEGYAKRKLLKQYSTTEEYTENHIASWRSIKLLNASVDNIDNPEKTLTEKYEVEIKAFDDLQKVATIVYNPFLFSTVKENPYTESKRIYPVELEMAEEVMIVFLCRFPERYQLEGSPTNISAVLPGAAAKYVTEMTVDGNSFIMSQVLRLNKTFFDAAEYPSLKEFYNKIIQTQKTDLVFKEKS